MKTYITIDGGTTNTRISLVKGGAVLANNKIPLGTRDCIDSITPFVQAIKSQIKSILNRHQLTENEITAIIASGMITSEYGLHNVAHIEAPSGIKELHDAMQKKLIPEISNVPFFFIPGVKSVGDSLCDIDVMRGEETEIMGLIRDTSDCVYVLPGSHTKIISLDGQMRISKIKTMLTGEMIAAFSGHTLLKATLNLDAQGYDSEYLHIGYEYCNSHGLSDAMFKTRLLKTVLNKTDRQIYSFFLGAILTNEVEELKRIGCSQAVIGGKMQIKNPLADLIRANTAIDVMCISDDAVEKSVPFGAVKIFEYQN